MSPIQHGKHGTTCTAIHPARPRRRQASQSFALAAAAALLLWIAALLPGGAAAAEPAAAATVTHRSAKPVGAAPVNSVKAAPAAVPAGFTLGAPPAWVEPVAVEPVPAALPKAPVQVLLVDRQIHLTGQGTSAGMHRFERWIRQINEASGLESASRVEIEFDPTTQKLQWHALALWRGGQRIDKLDAAKIQLLQREQQLERQMLDGRLTATLLLDDVRVGDRVEIVYSLVGANPVFEGRFVDQDWTVGGSGPLAYYRYRLLAPAGRKIRHQAAEAVEVRSRDLPGGQHETLFQRRLAPQFRWDPNAPGVAMVSDLLQLSEFADWAEVATWAQRLFATAQAGAGPALTQRAAALKAQATDPAQRLRLALDLVQTEVRYFGTEIGPYTHQPAAVDKVLTQRFGDCKDKAALLTALLAQLDVAATPVLVSQRYQRDVARLLPSPLAFDHAIAAVELDGRTLWLDATRSLQTGPAVERQSLYLGAALPARSAAGVIELPSNRDTLRSEAVDVFTVPDFAGDLLLEARQTLYGEHAEALRAQRSSLPAPEFERMLPTEYLRSYPGARVEGAPALEEVPDHNAVTLVQRFRIADAWRFPQQRQLASDFSFHTLMSVLRLPDQNPRQQALRLALPGIYRHQVEYRFSGPIFTRPGSSRLDDRNGFYELAYSQDNSADRQRLQAELRLPIDRIEATDWTRYRDQLVKSWPRLSGAMTVAALTPVQLEELRGRAAALDEDMRRGRIKPVTEVQREAHLRVLVLGEQLASGRLNHPKLRAEALVARGVQLDHLGRADAGRADLEQALALDPSHTELRSALAVNALMRGDDAAAIAHADAALQQNASDPAARYTRAYARFLRGEHAAARDELIQILASRSEVERGYGAVWLYLAARRAGGDGLAAIQPYLPQAQEPAWPYAVLRYFRGELDLDALQKAVQDRSSGRANLGQLCELAFYVAEKALADGDTAGAREWFQRSVDTGVVEFNEHFMSRRELTRLGGR